jgi:osomolarity two-component system, sensor histidine kinase SLN1
LNDLLTFSRNSYGQQLAIEDEPFWLTEISTQITSIFDKQARETQIELKVVYAGPANDGRGALGDANLSPHKELDVGAIHRTPSSVPAYGPGTTGLVQDMSLCGDKNRILQVLMNLVSNSLKFTPQGGAIEVRIRCVGWVEEETVSREK